MSEQKYEQGDNITESELENDFQNGQETSGAEFVDKKKELYAKDERTVERAKEKAGKKIQNSKPGDNNQKTKITKHSEEIIKLDADEQVDHLVKIATNQNPYLALKIAQDLEDNYVLAELHKDLTKDNIRQILVEKGLL